MACFIVASIVEESSRGFKTIGYKLYDTVSKKCELLTPETIKRRGIKLENAEFKGSILVGTQGDLKRYTKLNCYDGAAITPIRFVILGKDTEGAYIVVVAPNFENENMIRKCSYNELKQQVKIQNFDNEDSIIIANARVDNPDNVKKMSIRPIKGDFKIIEKCPTFIEKEFDFGKDNGMGSSKWKVRLVRQGERYGLYYSLNNDSENTLVEFYDMNIDKDSFPIGQFVSRYYLSTLVDASGRNGLSLVGDSDTWKINSICYLQIYDWLKKQK